MGLADGELRARLQREFCTPEPISWTGQYYPRYAAANPGDTARILTVYNGRYCITGTMETGTAHISYLSRPYFSYNTPSVYGYSK